MKSPKRLIFASTQKGAGLSSIFKGLLVSLRESGVSVRADIIGDSLIKATHYRRITGKISQNISPTFLSKEQILNNYKLSLNHCEVHCLLCEDISYLDSLAEDLDAVLFVVFDARRDNLEELYSKLELINCYEKVGLIANYVEPDYEIQSNSKYSIIGTIPDFTEEIFAGKSSLTMSRNLSLLTRNQLLRLKNLVNKHVDLKEFRHIFELSRDYDTYERNELKDDFVVALADDTAFHLSFQDNINQLYMSGASIVPFSPLADDNLPKNVDLIYFPNSYISLYLDELLNNKAIIKDIREKIFTGVYAYFEGDSIAYASKSLNLQLEENSKKHEMCDFIDLELDMEEVPIHNKYSAMKLTSKLDNFLIDVGDSCSAYTTNNISLKMDDFSLNIFNETNTAKAGICKPSNVFCTSSLLHWGSNSNIAKNIIRNCR